MAAATASAKTIITASLDSVLDEDLPGNGQFPCVDCRYRFFDILTIVLRILSSRYFIDEESRKRHLVTKLHKQRIKILKEVPYTQEEAEWAAGMRR